VNKLLKGLAWLVLPVTAFAAPTKGLQAVLLQCLAPESVKNMAAAVSASKIKQIEIASAPYLDSVCKPKGGRFDNLNTLVGLLLDAKLTEVRVTLHLGGLHDKGPDGQLGKRASEAWKSLKTDSKLKVHFSPSLEDDLDKDEFKKSVAAIAEGIGYDALRAQSSGKIVIRRSVNPGNRNVDLKYLRATLFADRKKYPKGSVNLDVRYESHAANPETGYAIWSNDGYLVYADESEHHTKHPDALLNRDPQRSITAFRAKKATTVLLWRPGYNLADRAPDPNDPKRVLISRLPSGRTDPGGASAKFGTALEGAAAIGFLK